MAIDRDAMFEDVYLGAGQQATDLIPPTGWAYEDALIDLRRPRYGLHHRPSCMRG